MIVVHFCDILIYCELITIKCVYNCLEEVVVVVLVVAAAAAAVVAAVVRQY